ncbi:MAG: ATP-binding protein [Rickettsiales bacterium]|jgi:AAA15 family ATPase/GTPase|nr:ATP-binding protein [Rickettsiales bacterium]
MEKTPIQKHPEHIIHTKLLSGAAVYGANASGKTNLLQAMGFLGRFTLLQSITSLNVLNSFMMKPNNPTEFEVNFISNNIKYLYKLSFSATEILNEELWFSEKTKQNLIFKRKGIHKELGKLFQDDWYKNRSFPKDITLLSKILGDGVVDNNITNHEHFVNVLEFLTGITFFNPKTEVPIGMIYNAFNRPEFKKFLLALLRQADFGITDIEFKPMNDISQEQAAKDPQLSQLVPGKAVISQFGDDYSIFTIEDGKIKGQILIAKHGDVPFIFSRESAGTIKLFKLGFLLYSFKNSKRSKLLLIDEFDGLFHPFLTKVLLQSLLNNHLEGQIIVALHNTMLLSHTIWRVDEIWFTEKDESGASRLYPLTDINPRFDKDLEQDYINGRYGAIPFLGGEKQWQEIIK